MNKFIAKISIIILLTAFLSACNAVKKVPSNKHLLTKNTLLIDGKKAKITDEDILEQITQQPNTTLLGYNFRLQMYNLANEKSDSLFKAKVLDNPKRYKSLSRWLSEKQVHRLGKSFWYAGWHNFLKKTGEPPVIIDSIKTKRNAKNLEALFINKGFLRAKSNYKINYLNHKRGTIEYTITKGAPYHFDTISKDIPNQVIDSLYSLVQHKSFIKQGEQFNDQNLNQEISRLTEYFNNHGVYQFQQQNIGFEIDTSYHKAPVIIKISDKKIRKGDSTFTKPYRIYKIDRVNIFLHDQETKLKKKYTDSTFYKNFHIYSTTKLRYRPKAIVDAVFIQKDNIFSEADRTLSQRSLSNLRVFDYPSILYLENTENNTLTANIHLVSKEKYSFKANADFTHSNIQDFGLAGNASFSIRNLFKGAEVLEFGIKGNIGSSKDFANPKELFFNIQEYGADLKLTFPRIFFPLRTNKIIPKTMFPSTLISAGFSKQLNIGLDKENFTSMINYSWTPSKKTAIKFDLANLQYIKNINTSNYFNVYSSSYSQLNKLAKVYNNDTNLVDQDGNLTIEGGGADLFMEYAVDGLLPTLDANSRDYKTIKSIRERKKRLTENNLILSTNFNYSKTSQKDFLDKDFYSFRAKLESAGNIMSLIADVSDRPKNLDGSRSVLGLIYSQYVKGEMEYIKHWDLRKKMSAAFRGFVGLALPYGNSSSIPFTRSYYAGGANDNRAWQSYSLGPGSSNSSNDFNEANFKISLNTEFRFNIFGKLNGALFADAGNIWNVLDSETDTKKIFSGVKSLESMALGTGLGFRYDFNFFVFRLDWGFKTYNPARTENDRWFTDMKLNKSVINIGINYPF